MRIATVILALAVVVCQSNAWATAGGGAIPSESIFVDGSVGGIGMGTQANPFKSLHLALTVADTAKHSFIYIATGTYFPSTTSSGGSTPAEDRTFLLNNRVELLGGWDGAALGTPAVDPALHPVTLSGALITGNMYHVLTVNTAAIGSQTVRGCSVSYGRADQPGSAVQHGGGLYMIGSAVKLDNCTFGSNFGENGGAIYSSQALTITDCTFRSNSADRGGAIYSDGSLDVECGKFLANSADYGGGVNSSASSTRAYFVNSVFCSNLGTISGGGFEGDMLSPEFINCTIAANYTGILGNGGGIYQYTSGTVALKNTIVWGNVDSSGFTEAAQVTLTGVATAFANFSCIQNLSTIPGIGSISANPLFDNMGNCDLQLSCSSTIPSPCVDTGLNLYVPAGITTDCDGNPRIQDGDCDLNLQVDMGAYECPNC